MPVTVAVIAAPIAADCTAITVPVFAAAANITLTAGTPTPADTTDTVAQIKTTPVPIATFCTT